MTGQWKEREHTTVMNHELSGVGINLMGAGGCWYIMHDDDRYPMVIIFHAQIKTYIFLYLLCNT